MIDGGFAGKTVKFYLFTVLGLSRAQVTALKKKENGILVNGERRFVTAVLNEGDRLSLALEDEESQENLVPYDFPLEILYEDDAVVCVSKPPQMPTHPSMHHYGDTLANALAGYYMKKGKPFVFRAANRLDRDTTGVVLVAKNKSVSCALAEQIAARSVEKRYLALLVGELAENEGVIEKNIVRAEKSLMLRRTDELLGDHAKTSYRVLERKNGLTLVEAIPHTGRTHQLRVHFASIGHPILGDTMYGQASPHIGRQALHAYSLTFAHPASGKIVTVCAPLPEDIQKVLKEFRFETVF